MNNTDWSAVLGLIAIPISVWRFQLHSRTALLMSVLPLVSVISLSYWLRGEDQGAVVALASSMVAMLQAFLGLGKHKHHILMHYSRVVLSVIAILCALFLVPPTSVITSLPFVAFIISKWADHHMNPFKMRRTILWATILWGIYAGLTHNPEILVLEILTLVSNVWWLVKYKATEKDIQHVLT
jgi:alpha-beta hydrolase superfamily lysophospholipase